VNIGELVVSDVQSDEDEDDDDINDAVDDKEEDEDGLRLCRFDVDFSAAASFWWTAIAPRFL
jgi:hypothetical protein